MRILPGSGGPARSQRPALLLLVALLLFGASACSDDEGDDAEAPDDTEDTTDDTTASTAPVEANICDDVPETDAATVNEGGSVGLIDFEFCGGDLTVDAGQSIRFVNYGATDHQVNHEPPAQQERIFRSPLMAPGEEFIVTLDDPGSYPYICTIHFELMTGVITVQ